MGVLDIFEAIRLRSEGDCVSQSPGVYRTRIAGVGRDSTAVKSAPGGFTMVIGMTAHKSDCAIHNAPAYEPGPCDCGAVRASDGAAEKQVAKPEGEQDSDILTHRE